MLVNRCLLFVALFQLFEANLDILSENFFQNLQAQPRLKVLNDESKRFIDNQIENYVRLATGDPISVKKKRSLLSEFVNNDEGVHLLSSIKPLAAVPVQFPTDISFFEQQSQWFVAALQSPNPRDGANTLIIFQQMNKTFTEITRTSIRNGVKISTIDLDNSTLIAVAENDSPKADFKNKSGVYLFGNSKLVKIQAIDMNYASDICLWRIHDDICMSFAQRMSNSSGNITYEVSAPVYRWLGKHFDLVQNIKTYGATKITPFVVGASNFLAIANSRNDLRETKLFSEIYKWNYHSERYELYQKILTKACNDIKVFNLAQNSHKVDTFLVVANSYTTGPNDTIEYETESIIYKFVDHYFIPFRWLSLNGLVSWTCVKGSDDLFVLIASTRFEGLKFFQYDGWSFKEIFPKTQKFLKERINSIGAVNFQGTTITVANKNKANSVNLFTLEFSHEKTLNLIYNELLSWCERGLKKVEQYSLEPILGKRADIEETDFDFEAKVDSLLEEVTEIHADTIIFNNVTIVQNLQASKVNNVETKDLLENVIRIEETLNLDKLKFYSMKAENLEVKSINGKPSNLVMANENLELNNVTVLGTLTVPEGIIIDQIQDLRVENVEIGGYLNDVDLPVLLKHSLKKGDENITARYVFETLIARNIQTETISGQSFSDLINVDVPFSLPNGIFTNIHVNNLTVTEFLGEIQVNEGKLDVLLRNASEEQEISGDKIFEDVIIHQAFALQGRINSKNLDRIKPVVRIDDNLFLEGDKTITQRVEVEDFAYVDDIIVPGGIYSVKRLQEDGLGLNEKKIKPHLQFYQQINVDEIFVDAINDKKPEDFVVVGSENPQIIRSVKTFVGNLSISGATIAHKINDVEVEDWENHLLMIDGDQTIEAKHHVKHMVANISSNNTVILDDGLTIDGNFDAVSVKARDVFVKQLINDVNFDAMVDDTVRKDSTKVIKGRKYFSNLTVNQLTAETDVNLDSTVIDELSLEGPLTLENVEIDKLYFDKTCNEVDRVDFGKKMDTILDDLKFNSITIHGQALIKSDKINDVDIGDLYENTVKVDEEFEFDSVIVDNVIAKKPIKLDGEIENFDFDNIPLWNDTIFDKTFSNLIVNETIAFDYFVNDLNLTLFCQFTQGKIANKNLTVSNAVFVKGPRVNNINEIDMKTIKNKAWFVNKNTTLSGVLEFDEVAFEDDVNVGALNHINLTLMNENYFSKTKDQNITSTFAFDEVTFVDNVKASEIKMQVPIINNVNIEEFVQTCLLDDYDQVFENVVFFENIFVTNLTGEFAVNGLDLATDVMRYDQINLVTGAKIFKNLNVDFLNLENNVQIQGVNVLDWFKNCVLKSTSLNITGTKIVKRAAFVKGFYVEGLLNTQKFDLDNVLVKDLPQSITGRKRILTPLVSFKGMKLKGLLNDVDLVDLINKQAYKNRDNIFRKKVNLLNNITTKNLDIKRLYQGVNMSELISNVTDLDFVNNLLQKYENLLEISSKLQTSIERQAFFLHHYKQVQTIKGDNSRKIVGLDGALKLGIFVPDIKNPRLDLYSWQHFGFKFNASIEFATKPKYVDQIFMGRYLYTEFKNHGTFMEMSHNFDNMETFFTNTTLHTSSIQMGRNEFCTVFAYAESQTKIFCEKNGEITLKQILPNVIAHKTHAVTISTTPHLLLVTSPQQPTESHVSVWRHNNRTDQFEFSQSLYATHSMGVSTASYENNVYLTVVSGRLSNAMYSGRVAILKYEETSREFVHFQILKLDVPVEAKLAVLPSNELVLYVLTENPTQPLLVFKYEGVVGFRLKVVGSALPQLVGFEVFEDGGQHLLVGQGFGEVQVIEAVFKGEKVD